MQAKWDNGYNHLLAFYKEYGHVQVRPKYVSSDGYPLGSWVRRQSYNYAKNKIKAEFYEKLIAVGFVFKPVATKNEVTAKWENGFRHLLEYYNTNGNSLVKRDYVCLDGFELGRWVHLQRIASKKNSLSLNQIERLLSIGCSLYIDNNTIYDAFWDKAFSYLLDYYNRYGDTFVKKSYKSSDGFSLGSWVSHQRMKYKKNLLTKSQIEKMQSVHFCFKDKNSYTWEYGYEKLQDYINIYGNSLVQSSFVTEDGFKLGRWCVEQRKRYSSLPLNKIRLLESVGFIFWKARNRSKKNDGTDIYNVIKISRVNRPACLIALNRQMFLLS